MKKILQLSMIALVVILSLSSCEEMVKENRVYYETRLLRYERAKIPLVLQNYQTAGYNIKDIAIDTVIATYRGEGSFKPMWGYFKTKWTFLVTPQQQNKNEYNYLFDDDDYYYNSFTDEVIKEYFVEIYEITYDGEIISYKSKWPEDPIKEIK